MNSKQGARRRKKSDRKNKGTSGGQGIDQQYADFLRPMYVGCRQNKQYCDVTLKVGNTTIESHRLILGYNSDFFASRFKNHFQEDNSTITLEPEFVDEQSLLKLVNAMYGAPFVIETDDLIPLFATSLFLQLTHYIKRCKVYIETHLDKIDTVALINMPHLQFDTKLYTLVRKHVCRNFSILHERMMSISLDLLKELFYDPDLLLIKKEQIFNFATKWITHDVENRKQHLRSVASALKPFYTFRPETLKIVDYLESAVSPSEDEVKFALNTLLDYPRDDSSHGRSRHELLTTPLFFVEPCDGNPMVFGTYKDQCWEYWNEMNQFRPPIASNLLSHKEAAVADNVIYMAGKLKSTSQQPSTSDLSFHGVDVKTRKWFQLLSPRKMPSCLISCDSKVFAYENFPLDEGYHVSVFESTLNRWFRLPAVNYRRKFSGIASSDHVLYMVGGIPMEKIKALNPTDLIEFYDSRCGTWTRLGAPSTSSQFVTRICHKRRYFKRVCFMENVIYMADGEEKILRGFDVRNYKFLFDWDRKISASVVQFLTAVDRTLWIIGGADDNGIEVISPESKSSQIIPTLNTALEPISMPYYY